MDRVEEITQEITKLSLEDQRWLLKWLLQRLQPNIETIMDPSRFFDDWDDPEVDKAYPLNE